MSATTPHTSDPTNEAEFPPAPSEAHQKAYAKGDVREIVENGLQIRMEYGGQRWWSVSGTTV
jgi:hypothetical protein